MSLTKGEDFYLFIELCFGRDIISQKKRVGLSNVLVIDVKVLVLVVLMFTTGVKQALGYEMIWR